MIKQNIPNMPNMSNMSDMPGMGAMADTLEFVKNLWGGMGLPGMNMSSMNMPGMVIPTLSVEEIKKKVSDLKAVETWLELNMNMLRSTIQALEVQAATIATLQSMGDALTATMKSAGTAAATGEYRQNGPQKTAAASSSAASSSKPEQRTSGLPGPTGKDEADAASLMTAPLVNAAAWWNLLQSQFNQAMSNAMTTEALVAGANGSDKAKGNGSSSSGSSPSSAKSESASAPARKRGRRAGD